MNSRDDVAKFMYACDQNGSDFGPQAELYVDLIIEEFKGKYTANHFFAKLLRGTDRNWYPVTAIDSTNENVRNIYLPFHPVFAPRPTSMNVQVIHKANEEDIEKFREHLPALSSPLLDYNSAEEFFEAGYRFKTGTTSNPDIIKLHN